jgi:ABC-type thiamin/hydroxymethylpyrimidine transport system permease subunit
MNFKTRELVLLAVFGALWGASEIMLGSVLHNLKVPFNGVILAGIGLLIALIGRVFIPKRGATFFIGVIATILKLFSIGSVVVGPMIGILAEALLAELILTLSKRPSRPAFMLAGSLGVLWTLLHPFFTGLLLFGRSIVEVWLATIQEGSRLLGLKVGSGALILAILLILIVIRVIVGGLAGWLAWDVGKLLKTRTG